VPPKKRIMNSTSIHKSTKFHNSNKKERAKRKKRELDLTLIYPHQTFTDRENTTRGEENMKIDPCTSGFCRSYII
jgi:hypothetical protein